MAFFKLRSIPGQGPGEVSSPYPSAGPRLFRRPQQRATRLPPGALPRATSGGPATPSATPRRPRGAPRDAFERHRQPLESLKNVGFCSISSNWTDQGADWWVPGRLCRDPGHLWRLLGRPRGYLAALGAALGATWGALGDLWRHLGVTRGSPRRSPGPPGVARGRAPGDRRAVRGSRCGGQRNTRSPVEG